MAKNDFLPFATADGANVLSAEDYQTLHARSNGFSAGVARSQELNTVWRQASVIAHVVAQFIADTNNSDVADDGDLQILQDGLRQALSQHINHTVKPASLTTAGITQLSSATHSDSETMAATPKAVKVLAAQTLAKDQNGADIADKQQFLRNLDLADIAMAGICEGIFLGNGYISIPAIIKGEKKVLYIQWGNRGTGSNGSVTINFPVAFPETPLIGFVSNSAESTPAGFGGIGRMTKSSAVITSSKPSGGASSAGVSYNYLVIGY